MDSAATDGRPAPEPKCIKCSCTVPRGARVCCPCAPLVELPGGSCDPAVAWPPLLAADGLQLSAAMAALFRVLEAADAREGMFAPQGAELCAAVRRYTCVWLPAAGLSPQGLPPPDVEWVWLVHRLAPQHYERDCTQVCGGMVEFPLSALAGAEGRAAAEQRGREQWSSMTAEPWDAPQGGAARARAAAACGEGCRCGSVGYDLRRSAAAQAQFVYQTSRPQFRESGFRSRAQTRYLRFLSMAPRRIERMIVPAYDVDMAWHAHMSVPQLYTKHCKALVGYTVWHDDSLPATHADGGRSAGSTLEVCFTATSRLYTVLFHESYRRLECEYRGHDRPQGWRYAGSVEEALTRLRPEAVMIGGAKPPDSGADPLSLDAADPSNARLHRYLTGKAAGQQESCAGRVLRKCSVS